MDWYIYKLKLLILLGIAINLKKSFFYFSKQTDPGWDVIEVTSLEENWYKISMIMITLITMIILIIVIIKINIKQTDPGRDVIEVASLEDGTRRRLIAEDQVILIISMMREAWPYQNT